MILIGVAAARARFSWAFISAPYKLTLDGKHCRRAGRRSATALERSLFWRDAMDSPVMPTVVSSFFVRVGRSVRGGPGLLVSAAGRRDAFVALITGFVSLLAACATTVDKSSVKANEGAPVSAQVEIVRIPYDASLPKYIVTVEPLKVGAEGQPGAPVPSARGGRHGWGPWGFGWWGSQPNPAAYAPPAAGLSDRVSAGIAAQLISAFGNAGNIVVLDHQHYLENRGNLSALRGGGELGPFVIKGTVTEFNEVAEAGEKSKGVSLGWAGTVLGIVGGLAGVPAAGYTGAAISAADPTYKDTRMRRTGSVGMDLQIVDPQTGRILGSGVAAGKFTAETATSGISVFGVGGGESAFASSALGQATRAAANDAVRQLTERLSAMKP